MYTDVVSEMTALMPGRRGEAHACSKEKPRTSMQKYYAAAARPD